MPATALKHFAKKSGHTLADVEHKWAHAKKIVKDQYDKSEDDPSFWALTTGVLKKMLGLKEAKSFKEFINERAIDKQPEYLHINEEEALRIFNTHCKDAMWMLDRNEPLFRGDRFVDLPKGFATVNTSATQRESQNTKNYYTLILDNVLNDSFPKRSRSFIAANTYDRADGYSRDSTPFIIIPYDGVKIGIVGKEDIWDNNIELFDIESDLDGFNMFWSMFDSLSEHDWQKWIDYDKRLQDNDEAALAEFNQAVRYYLHAPQSRSASTDFLKKVKRAYGALNLGMKSATTKTLLEKIPHTNVTEVWIGGECLLIHLAMWQKMVTNNKRKQNDNI